MATHADFYLVGVPISMAQPEAVLPAQYFGPRRKQTPEHRLMMAVLRDALECLEKYRFATDNRGRRLFREAEKWCLTKEAHWPYSFESICAVLELDSNAVRTRLLGVGRGNRRVGVPLPRDVANQGSWKHCKQARLPTDVTRQTNGRTLQ